MSQPQPEFYDDESWRDLMDVLEECSPARGDVVCKTRAHDVDNGYGGVAYRQWGWLSWTTGWWTC